MRPRESFPGAHFLSEGVTAGHAFFLLFRGSNVAWSMYS